MPRLVAFGEVMARLAPPDHLTFRQALPGAVTLRFGGAEANVAAGVALLGGKAAFVTALPDHPVAEACLSQLRGIGVDVTGVARPQSGRMGLYFVEVGANQRASSVVYDREGSALAVAAPDLFDWSSLLAPGDWLHISGITPAISENAALATVCAASTAKTLGCRVSLDLNFRAKLWRWREGRPPRELAREVMGEVLPSVDLLVGNEEDAESVLGIAGSEVQAGRLDHERYVEVAKECVLRYPSLEAVAFTLRGSLSASHNTWAGMLYLGGEAYFAPLDTEGHLAPYQITDIVDRMGAGDSFVAGLLSALMEGQPPSAALRFAVAASCLKHSLPGDYNYATRAEVVNLISGSTSGRVVR